jgi:hypothetical protein
MQESRVEGTKGGGICILVGGLAGQGRGGGGGGSAALALALHVGSVPGLNAPGCSTRNTLQSVKCSLIK